MAHYSNKLSECKFCVQLETLSLMKRSGGMRRLNGKVVGVHVQYVGSGFVWAKIEKSS